VALAILMELNIRLTVLVVETARLERRGVNDTKCIIFLACFASPSLGFSIRILLIGYKELGYPQDAFPSIEILNR
jgi:hypothetical protein